MNQQAMPAIGAPVVTRDGEQVGTVKEVRGQYFKVDVPMAPDYWLNTDAVDSSQGGQVMLSFDKDRIDEYKAVNPGDKTDMGGAFSDRATDKASDMAAQGRSATTSAGQSMPTAAAGASWDDYRPTYQQNFTQRHGSKGVAFEAAEPGYRYGHELAMDQRFADKDWTTVETEARKGYSQGNFDQVRDYAREGFEARRLQLREERLRPVKERVEAGEVELRKEVISEERTVDVPVTREEVYITRRDVTDGRADGEIGDGETIRVPVSEEHARLEKETVVTGEVEIGKRAVQETEHLSGTVRREEARVVKDGDVNVADEERVGTGDVRGFNRTTETDQVLTDTEAVTDDTTTTRNRSNDRTTR